MRVIATLLVMPAITALAMPVVTVTNVKEILQRAAIVGPPVQPQPLPKKSSSVTDLQTATAPIASVTQTGGPDCNGICPLTPVPTSTSEEILPREDLNFVKRDEGFIPDAAETVTYLSPATASVTGYDEIAVETGSYFPIGTAPVEKREDSLDSISNIIAPLDKRVEEPDLPEFVDTGSCICGLLASQTPLLDEGELVEWWRCTAPWQTSIITEGGNGKWYQTEYPSQEISGLGQPRNWGDNPPAVSNVYVLTFQSSGPSYEILDVGNAGALHGDDYMCTGVNDTVASTEFYATQ